MMYYNKIFLELTSYSKTNENYAKITNIFPSLSNWNQSMKIF